MKVDPKNVEERVAAGLSGRLEVAWRLGIRTAVDTADDRVPGLAAEAAFFTLLSLPPLLLVVVGAFSYAPAFLPEPDAAELIMRLENAIESVTTQVFSAETVQLVNDTVASIIERGRLDILSVGVVFSLWSGSRATNTFITAITIAYDIDDPRPLWHRRLLALGITIGAAVIGVAIFPALVLGPDLIAYITPSPIDVTAQRLVELAFWPTVGIVTIFLLAVLYHLGVPWSTPWRRDLPGAVLAMALWLLGSLGLRYYADLAIRDGTTLKAFAAPLVAMLWLYVTAFAVLLGAELNAELVRFHDESDDPDRTPEPEPATAGRV